MNPEQARWFGENFANVVGNVERVIIGKAEAIRLAVTCLLAEGHLLLEDYPGTGKTTLARALAQSVQGTNSRIQFTPDLLPSDVTGVTIYDQKSGEFEFHQGPIFASIVLAAFSKACGAAERCLAKPHPCRCRCGIASPCHSRFLDRYRSTVDNDVARLWRMSVTMVRVRRRPR